MFQKIVFQDNVYQLSRLVDLISEGLQLDLSNELFFTKLVDDILFLDESISKVYSLLNENTLINGYNSILHGIYSCQMHYMNFLDNIIKGNTSLQESFDPLLQKIQSIRNKHFALSKQITDKLKTSHKNNDFNEVVSQNELSELLQF